MKRIVNISTGIVICLLVGFVSSRFQTEAIIHWYPTLNKPALTPPNIIFPIAWTILYILMGISLGLIINGSHRLKLTAVILFVVQLVLNFFWSILFFYLQNPLLGLMDIIVLDLVVVLYVIKSHAVNKVSAWLFIPYLLWILFATYLNAYVYVAN